MKPTSKYYVEKHVSMAMYYDHTDHGLRRAQLRQLWMTWARLSGNRASSAFWAERTAIMKPRMVELGDPEIVDSLLVEVDDIIEGGGTYTRTNVMHNSMLDCDFYQSHDRGKDFGIDMARTYFWTLSKQWLGKMSKSVFSELMNEQMTILDSSQPYCGLVDYSLTHETYAGFTYGTIFSFSSPLGQCIQRFRWLDIWNSGKKVLRGLYWGNYFSNRLLQGVGGRDVFITRYKSHLNAISRDQTSHIWEYPNGIFIRLTPDINNVEPGKRIDGISSQNFQWLTREFDKHGLLL